MDTARPSTACRCPPLLGDGVPPTEEEDTLLIVDDLEALEWRQASTMPDIKEALTHAHSVGEDVALSLEAWRAALECRQQGVPAAP